MQQVIVILDGREAPAFTAGSFGERLPDTLSSFTVQAALALRYLQLNLLADFIQDAGKRAGGYLTDSGMSPMLCAAIQSLSPSDIHP